MIPLPHPSLLAVFRLTLCWFSFICLHADGRSESSATLNLSQATVVVRSGTRASAEVMAAQVLVEEVQKRTGFRWEISTNWPKSTVAIAISAEGHPANWPTPPRNSSPDSDSKPKAEGFRFTVSKAESQTPAVWILGSDSRGSLFGVGEFLRALLWAKGHASLPYAIDLITSPALPIRGHQLGYRHTANSYDGWDDKQFDQYIRELALFGANSIEGIPFHDTRTSPHMPLPREVMNRRISEICARYELDYWIWAPAEFDLKDALKREAHRAQHVALFRDCPRLNAIFFPGGDPGNNQPNEVLAYLTDLSGPLLQSHPKAKIWLSMQGFKKNDVEFVYDWINKNQPDWLGGLVAGPSSPPIPEIRTRLPLRYGLRDYPDITHTVRCQFPVPWWDPSFHLTLGREPVNPRPVFYKAIQDYFGPFTSGFITYSDGIHDDVNKAVFSRLGWQPELSPRAILLDYTRYFFGDAPAESAADGILALEKNWEGALVENGSVEATLTLWQTLESAQPQLQTDWRWQLCLLRAYYDAYTRQRLIFESDLELSANADLATATQSSASKAINTALTSLRRPFLNPLAKQRRTRISRLCQDLFESIQLQTSVPQYQASGYERGAVLDFVDHPLNNRWWLEDEFSRILTLPSEKERLRALEKIRMWKNPSSGSFYDEVGSIAQSPHVIRGEGINTDPAMERNPNPGFWWWNDGLSRHRLSWQTSIDWPLGLRYSHLDPLADYRLRIIGFGLARPRANGQLIAATSDARIEVGQPIEFLIPSSLLVGGYLTVTFDSLPEEAALNWRQQSRVSEVWLLKQ